MSDPNKFRTILTLLLRLGFGALMISASIHKIMHPYDFAQTVEFYGVLNSGLSRWVAVWLPCLEALLGLLLIIGIWLDAAAVANLGLMFLFLILMTQAYLRGLDIRCGCYFFQDESVIGLRKILENSLLTLLAAILVSRIFRRSSNEAI